MHINIPHINSWGVRSPAYSPFPTPVMTQLQTLTFSFCLTGQFFYRLHVSQVKPEVSKGELLGTAFSTG